MKFRRGLVLFGMTLCLTAGTAFGQEDLKAIEEKIMQRDCNLCHSYKRIYTIDPAKITEVVERMRKKNPDWFLEMKSEHVVTAIARMIQAPEIIAAREAWNLAVERGGLLFKDASLGKKGVSCISCHNPPEKLRNVSDVFPRWDPELKRFTDINEAINRMIVNKVGGEALPPNDQRLFDLIAYLKSLQ